MVDLEARLKTAQISRDRLRALLHAAVKLDDIISLEAELGEREATVEQLIGQLGVIGSQVAYATVNLTLFERSTAAVDDTRTTPKEGFRRGWVALRETGSAIVVGLATIAVWLPFGLLAGWLLRKWFKRERTKLVNTPLPGWSPSTGQAPLQFPDLAHAMPPRPADPPDPAAQVAAP